ncbi:MAG: hypothetical protein CM15mV102_260 [uncultured marine virus]|nr:MAG: hypothetical protein CM15mV102_260 [uncultured marine virus]
MPIHFKEKGLNGTVNPSPLPYEVKHGLRTAQGSPFRIKTLEQGTAYNTGVTNKLVGYVL